MDQNHLTFVKFENFNICMALDGGSDFPNLQVLRRLIEDYKANVQLLTKASKKQCLNMPNRCRRLEFHNLDCRDRVL